jgi:hypothetical protein
LPPLVAVAVPVPTGGTLGLLLEEEEEEEEEEDRLLAEEIGTFFVLLAVEWAPVVNALGGASEPDIFLTEFTWDFTAGEEGTYCVLSLFLF